MDLLTEMAIGFVRESLPQGVTLAGVKPAAGRLDALVSHGIAYVIQASGNPLAVAMYEVARPMVDGALVGACGPCVIAGPVKGKRVAGRKSSAVAKRRRKTAEKKREFTDKGVEILDAEFVDVPA